MVGSFGAGISLAIASSLILMIVSSVVAFRSWPDDLNGMSEPTVANLSQDRPSNAASPGVADADVALPNARTSTASAGTKGRASSSAAAGDPALVDGAGASSSAGGSSGTSAAAGHSSGGASSGTSAKTDPGRQVAGVVHQVGDTVGKAIKGAGDAVGPVAPVVGRTLETIGASGGAAVDQVGQTAGSAVQTVLP